MSQTQTDAGSWLHGPAQSFKANFAFDFGFRVLGGEKLSLGTAFEAAKNSAIWTLLGPFGLPVNLARPLASVGQEIGKSYSRANADWGRHYQTTNFNREAAYTMRQRAVQAIQGSKLNARSALGSEASLMHR